VVAILEDNKLDRPLRVTESGAGDNRGRYQGANPVSLSYLFRALKQMDLYSGVLNDRYYLGARMAICHLSFLLIPLYELRPRRFEFFSHRLGRPLQHLS
jgi:hypothetical protein